MGIPIVEMQSQYIPAPEGERRAAPPAAVSRCSNRVKAVVGILVGLAGAVTSASLMVYYWKEGDGDRVTICFGGLFASLFGAGFCHIYKEHLGQMPQ